MSISYGIESQTKRLSELAPEGFFFALHIHFAVPLVYHQTYPQDWTDQYSEEGYALRDPIIAWGFRTVGCTRWSDLAEQDSFDVLGKAQFFGLNHGLAVSCGQMRSRTIASASRGDREFTDQEIEGFQSVIHQLHQMTESPASLTDAQVEALQCIANGDRHAAAAARLNISESAFKARLVAARTSLLARTTVEAIQRARDYRLI